MPLRQTPERRAQNSSSMNKEAERLQRRQEEGNPTSEASSKRRQSSISAAALLRLVFSGSPPQPDVSPGAQPAHLFLLPPLPAQLSVGGRHGLDHEGGGHVAAGGKQEVNGTEAFRIICCFYSCPGGSCSRRFVTRHMREKCKPERRR